MFKKYQLYIGKIFIKNLFLISIIFLGLSFILNFFEELKFFDNYDVGIRYPILLTFLNTPSILFELFPFIFLIAVKFFYIHLNERNEIEIFKNHGIDNLKVLSLLRQRLKGIQNEFLIFPLLKPFLGSGIFPSNLSLLLASITLNNCFSIF